MPTYLTHDNAPIYSTTSDFVHLDPATNLGGLGNEKYPTNGDPVSIPLRQSHPRTINESFDDSSTTSSAHVSDTSDSTPTQMNGTRPTSMSSLPNGKNQPAGGSDATEYSDASTDFREEKRPFHNGTTVAMPDRTAPPPPPFANGGRTADHSVNVTPTDAYPPRTSIGSAAAGSIQHSPVEFYQKPIQSNGNGSPLLGSAPALTTIHSQTEPATDSVTPSLLPAPSTPTPDLNHRRQNSPHRFSSPPMYHSAGATPNASMSAGLQPPNAGLKHRHTLEVPKLQPGRGSKDGFDSAFSSGRFSPTSATPGARRASLSLVRRNTRSMQSDFPRDEILPDEDALRWAEAYRQKRASKRKRREEEDDDRVLVGTKVDEHHANWVTAYNMLTGIRVSVSRTNAKLDRQLTDADFEAKQKSTFDIAGNEMIPSAKYDFKFKDYAPWVFRHLRALFRLDPADYLMSLTGKYILSELGSPGKSGSFFYFSRDYKYIIKTIHHAEHKFLRKILKDYYKHVNDNPNTLLSQFYGLHRVKMPYGKKIHFVVMNNLFPPHRDIHQTFDLKGSTIGRDYKEDDLAKNPRATLKDLNWLRRSQHLELGIQKKRLFLEQLQRDVILMKRLKIMDYSLLIGIHDVQRGNEENLRDKTLQVFNPGGDGTQDEFEPQSVLLRTPSKLENARKARELRQMIRHERPIPMGQTASKMPDELEEGHSRPGFIFTQDDGGFRATHENNAPAEEIYYLGVIDCLTHYGIIKKVEHFWKGLTNDSSQISALPPEQYGERFFHFVEGITMSAEEAAREKQMKEQAAAETAAAAERERVTSWNSSNQRRSSVAAVPPIPNYQPPPIPGQSPRSPEAQATIDRASHEARKSEGLGTREEDIPDRVLTTKPNSERRESTQGQGPILPVVEEAAEASSTGGSREEDGDIRPLTPAKDGVDGRIAGLNHHAPPTPPKTGYLQPRNKDSGYGAVGNGNGNGNGHGTALSRDDSVKLNPRLSRDSLDKDLPPLPTDGSEGRTARVGVA